MEESASQDLLKRGKILHLATLKPDGAPTVRPVNFLYDENRIYIHTGPKSGKIDRIRQDPRVSFEIEQVIAYIPAKETPCSATYSCRSIVGEGKAYLVTDGKKKQAVLQKMMKKYQPEGGYRPVNLKDTEVTAIIEIMIEDLTVKSHLRE